MRVSEFWTALERRQRSEPAAPFVTWYGADEARAELSTVTYATSVAKTAGMLIDDLEVEPGDRVRLALPLHWQLPVWLGACDLAGLTIVWDLEPTAASVTVVPEPEAAPSGITVVSPDTPFGMPVGPVPDPLVDHFRAAMGQPDTYMGAVAAGSWYAGGATWDGSVIATSARALADSAGLSPGGRLLVRPGTSTLSAALASWALPLLFAASVVLVQEGDVEHIAAAEETTAVL